MVKKIMIDLDDIEHEEIIKVKGMLTWKELFLKGVEVVKNDNL